MVGHFQQPLADRMNRYPATIHSIAENAYLALFQDFPVIAGSVVLRQTALLEKVYSDFHLGPFFPAA